jgi:hypothetical protein
MLELINYKRCIFGALSAIALPIWAQEQAKVISSTPVFKLVTENQQV